MAEYYTLEEMAKIMGVSPSTLKNKVSARRDHPPVSKPRRGVYLFPKNEFQAWLCKRRLYSQAS